MCESKSIILRFCAKDYHPFNAKNKKSYVVDDEYTPAWEVRVRGGKGKGR